MESRQISGTRLISSSIGLGCLGFAGAYGSADRAQSVLVIRLALDLRVTFLAVADFYGGGAVEQIVGDAIADRRDDALIATQGGLHFTDSGRPTRIDGSPKYLKQACDASLKRLKVDHVDLYTLSRPDPRVPIEESVGGIAALVRAGKVRHVGLRGVSAATLRRAHAEYPITAIEGEYSLWERQVETDVLPMARQLGIGFVACSPLGRGFLTGRVTSVHRQGHRPGSGRAAAHPPGDERLSRAGPAHRERMQGTRGGVPGRRRRRRRRMARPQGRGARMTPLGPSTAVSAGPRTAVPAGPERRWVTCACHPARDGNRRHAMPSAAAKPRRGHHRACAPPACAARSVTRRRPC